MLCPVCSVELSISDRSGVEIDFCPKCRGVWLDRGELDKIIERSAGFAMQGSNAQNSQNFQHSQHYQNHQNFQNSDAHHPQNGYYKKKKESWLGELFDF